jgi:large subunit ribosomal protein L18e
MISKTKIENRMQGKTNAELIQAIILLKKVNPEAARLLARPRRKMIKLNLEEIDKECKEGESILIPGKILGNGMLNKKVRIVAFSASEQAIEKIKGVKSEFITISDELKKNKELKNLRLYGN